MKSKIHAAGIHLAINIVLFSLLLLVLLKLWYPTPYFTASGGLQGLKIVALVDIVLGPLLTFVVVNPLKNIKALKMDLGIILFLQICAFIWGTYTVFMQRPIATVFWENQFYTVPAKYISSQNLSPNNLIAYGGEFPVFAYVDRAITRENVSKIQNLVDQNDLPPFAIVSLFEQHTEYMETIAEHSLNMELIREHNPNMAEQMDKLLLNAGANADQLLYIKLESKYQNIIAVLKMSGEIVGYISAPMKDDVD